MTNPLDLLWFPLRHLFHFVLLTFRLQTQPIGPSFTMLDPHIWEGSVFKPAILGKRLLLVTQKLVKLGIANKRSLARFALH
jgi:hypothetical protein